MASYDKQQRFYVKKDPVLGEIRGMDPWAVENGMHILRIQRECTEGIMLIRADNQQQYGTVHGGMLVAFADTVAGHSMAAYGRLCVTQSSTVNFLRPADGAYLFCRATPIKVGRRMCVASVEQWNDREEQVTSALFTFAVVQEIDPVLVRPKYPNLRF